jgi:hypothetical protein
MLPMNGMNNGGGGQPQGIKAQAKNCWAGIPLFCRWTVLTVCITQLVAFFLPAVLPILACVPSLIISNFFSKSHH